MWFDWSFSSKLLRPHTKIWFWINLTFAAITKIFRIWRLIRISNRELYFYRAYICFYYFPIIIRNMTKLVTTTTWIFILFCAHSFRGIRRHTSLTVWRSTTRALEIYDVIFGDFMKGVYQILGFECSLGYKYNNFEYIFLNIRHFSCRYYQIFICTFLRG
jgi:hypothetical protein